jgi:hypothetical protein
MGSGDGEGDQSGFYFIKYIGPHVQEEIWASTIRILAQANAARERVVSDPMPGRSGAIIKALQGVAALHAVGFADKAGAARLATAASQLFADAGKELKSS